MSKRFSWLVVAGLFGATALAAQQPPPSDSLGPRPFRQRMQAPGRAGFAGAMLYTPERLVNRRDALKLTPEQVSRLEALAQEARQARQRADTAARSHADALRQLWEAPAPDVKAIEQHHQALATARQAASLAEVRAAAQAKAVLTDEQRGHVAGWRDGARLLMRRDARPGGRGPGMPGQRVRPRGRTRPI
ncbi:MAG TPA: Spy/CpxP family protein refolding chaperone [Gemmatimonadales bacterium]|nr:Spy/CpxP family protein refolding chaperone [Gemmatimonadales bacterium]